MKGYVRLKNGNEMFLEEGAGYKRVEDSDGTKYRVWDGSGFTAILRAEELAVLTLGTGKPFYGEE